MQHNTFIKGNYKLIIEIKVNFPVICLCGSTKFKEEFENKEKELALEGNLVLSVSCFGHYDNDKRIENNKEMLDKIHLQKIDMSEGIFVINKGGYIGESTKKEIDYARKKGKYIKYLEPIE